MSNLKDVRIKNIPILVDGKEHQLRFTLNAFAELEDAYGSVDAAMKTLQSGSMKAVRKLLWAGLLHEDENLTEKQVGNMLDTSNLQEFTQALTNALGVAMPDAEATDPNAKTQK
jgi:hypothetical protein